jgi:preprotein translocase subunit SecD
MKQNNTTKLVLVLAFLALSIYYLQFTVRNVLQNRYIDSLEGQARIDYIEQNQESINNLRERTLNLGLDLQGGMHVALEIRTPQLLIDLANEGTDSLLINSIGAADLASVANNTDIIDEFVTEFESRDSEARLSRYYRNDGLNITRRSTNAEIRDYLRSQRDAAIDRAIEIVRTRVDRFGVTEPSIVKQGANRIIVELPGVDDETRVRNLLRGAARLEFHLTADQNEMSSSLNRIITYYNSEQNVTRALQGESAPQAPAAVDTTAAQTDAAATDTTATDTSAVDSTNVAGNPLVQVFLPANDGISLGTVAGRDTARVNKLMSDPAARAMLPRNTKLLWTAKPVFTDESGMGFYNLLPVRAEAELTGEVITEARPDFDPFTNAPQVSMRMNTEGARVWSRVTGANIGKPIAIVLDNLVYTYPNVQNKISDGNSSITGIGSLTEAEDLVNILMSGALPAPLDIVEERTVGPSLGATSINQGFMSVVLGLAIVAVFMFFYYKMAGLVAVVALLLNIVFLLGIMAAFRATLTLPGIAGIVLTIGMAVDANVLIFERIREELDSGKSYKAAVDAGFANALSAILDSNITTFLTGAILYSFGVGPIKGFAVTLMAGIVASLFSALVITRMLVDTLTRKKAISLG